MAGSSNKKSDTAKNKLLIIEDERPLAHALELKFAHEGLETKVAANGEDGLTEANKGKFDVILLDLIMPGMDGFTFMEKFGDKMKKSKVIVLSNLGQDEDRSRAEELGAHGYFVKSTTPISDIVQNVKSAL